MFSTYWQYEIRSTNVVLFFLSKSTQLPIYEEFIITYVCLFLKFFLIQLGTKGQL